MTGSIAGFLINAAIVFGVCMILYFGNYRKYRHLVPSPRVMSDKERLDRTIRNYGRVFVVALVSSSMCFLAIFYSVYQTFDDPQPIQLTYGEELFLLGLCVSIITAMVAGFRRNVHMARRHGRFVVEFEG